MSQGGDVHVRARPTIDEVAAAAGVSRSTVSRVINADPRVSDSAYRAVTCAMESLAYRPDPTAQSLARMRAHPPAAPVERVRASAYRDRMSEAGWQAFLSAEGLEDWVVLHGGPTAVFRTESLQASAELAAAIAGTAGLGPRTVLTAASDRLTVKLTRELWATESAHIGTARAVSEVARAQGARADRGAVQEVQVAVSARPEQIDLPFWRAVLGYAPLSDDNGLDPLGQGSTVWMQELDPAKPLRHAMHIDVSVARDAAEGRVTAAVAAGGRIVTDAEAPAAWILADRAGNKVCIAAWPDGAPGLADD